MRHWFSRLWKWGAPLFLFFMAVGKIAEWWSELWWFAALGQSATFWQLAAWRAASFGAGALLFILVLGWHARRAWQIARVSAAPLGLDDGETTRARLIPLEDKLHLDIYRNRATVWTIGIFAWLAGWAAAVRFELWLRAFSGQKWGETEPFFGRDFGFYVFQLPAIESVYHFVFTAVFSAFCLATTIYVYEETLELGGRRVFIAPSAARHLGMLGAVMLALRGFGWWLERFELLSRGDGWFGAGFNSFGYAQAQFRVPALNFLVVVAIVLASLASWYFIRHQARRGWFLLSLGWPGGAILLWLITARGFSQTTPARQQPFLASHADATRRVWKLDNIVDWPNQNPTPELWRRTLDNLAIWPPIAVRAEWNRLLQKAGSPLRVAKIQQGEQIIKGQTRPVYWGVCEMPLAPNADWDERHRTQVSGDGLFVCDSARSGPNGELIFYRQPPILRGAGAPIWFGELPPAEWPNAPGLAPASPWQVATLSNGDADETFVITEGGAKREGVSIFAAWQRALLAWRFFDWRLLHLQAKPSDQIVWRRRVTARVGQLAPFVDWQSAEPRAIETAPGQIVWLLDGFARSSHFPLSARLPGAVPNWGGANYRSPIVTATVNAQNGATNFYLLDENEPFSPIYRRAFPALWKRRDQMPASIAQQWRPSAALATARALVWARYGKTGAAPATLRPAILDSRAESWPHRALSAENRPFTVAAFAPSNVEEIKGKNANNSANSTPAIAALLLFEAGEKSAPMPRLFEWNALPSPKKPQDSENFFAFPTQFSLAQALDENGRSSLVLMGVFPLGDGLALARGAVGAPPNGEKSAAPLLQNQFAALTPTKQWTDANLGFLATQLRVGTPNFSDVGGSWAQRWRSAQLLFAQMQKSRGQGDWAAYGEAEKRLKIVLGGAKEPLVSSER